MIVEIIITLIILVLLVKWGMHEQARANEHKKFMDNLKNHDKKYNKKN